MLDIIQLPVMEDNYIYLLHDQESGKTAVVDPAIKDPVLDTCQERGWTLDYIFNTHHHWDHTGANKALKAETGCTIIGFEGDKDRIPGIDDCVKDGDTVTLGTAKAKVIEIPGHTSGHIAYYFERDQALFDGDTIFAMGCGRLFEGTPKQMWHSMQKLTALPDETKIYCAHEYTLSNGKFALSIDGNNQDLVTRMDQCRALREAGKATVPFTLGEDKRTNPFLRPFDPAIRQHLQMEQASDSDVFGKIRALKDNF